MHQNIICRSISLFFLVMSLVSSNKLMAADLEQGKQLAEQCVACHGQQGNSNNPIWPNIAGQHASYLSKQMHDFISENRKNAQMAGIVANLSEEDVVNLSAYFATQKHQTGLAHPVYVAVGQTIYQAGDSNTGLPACMACHGPKGTGNPAANYPKLSGQHAQYTIAQMRAFKAEQRNNDKNAVMRSIASKMTEAQIKAVAEYIQGLR